MQIGEAVAAICKQLSRLAATGKLGESECGEFERSMLRAYGVLPMLNSKEPTRVRFQFVTKDDLAVSADADLLEGARNPDYFAGLAYDLCQRIDMERGRRRKLIVPPNIMGNA